jgi:hypothetical protein
MRSKLAFSKYNKIYLSVIAFIVFILHEIKQRKSFLGHPVYFVNCSPFFTIGGQFLTRLVCN